MKRMPFGACPPSLLAVLSMACGTTVNVGDARPPENASDDEPPANDAPSLPPAAPATLDWNGEWEWLAPLTTTQRLRAGWVAAPDDVWLVGDGGTILRWDGKTRARVAYQASADARHYAITGSSADDVWIAGDHSALHFNGITWTSSLYLADYDVRALVRSEDGRILARTADEQVLSVVPHNHATTRDVLDVVSAPGGGHYLLMRGGVYWLGARESKRVVSFDTTQDMSRVFEGRLLGTAPSSFRYLLGSRPKDDTLQYALYDSVDLRVARWNTPTIYRSPSDPATAFFGRVDSDRLFMRIPRHDDLVFFDKDQSRVDRTIAGEGGAFLLPPHGPVVVGCNGLVASMTPSSEPGRLEARDLSRGGGDRVELFAVAPDSSAYGAKSTLYADESRSYVDTFGRWEEGAGWRWNSLPEIAGDRRNTIVALAPLSSSSVWALIRAKREDTTLDVSGQTLAHWNGSSFDTITRTPRRLHSIKSDGEGGFFALGADGELSHADAQANLTHLADAGTAGEDPFILCEPRLAPISNDEVWVLDNLCRLSFWNGSSLEWKPGFREPLHGSGLVGFEMWAASDKSLWVTDPIQGLRHFDGKEWRLIWRSERRTSAIWGVDDRHVWFLDGNYDPQGRAVLEMWDGNAVEPVATAPSTYTFGGGKESIWLSGDMALLRLRAKQSGSTR